MIAVLLFGLIAAAAAAPHRFPHGPPPYAREHRPNFGQYDPFNEDTFDTRQFWAGLATEMREIDEMLATLSQRFAASVSRSGIEGNTYKITIPLNSFEEKDIVVKAKEGFVMVQAVHKTADGGENIYLDAKTIPTCVNVTGTWKFEQGVLKIVFPLKVDAAGTTEAEIDVTERPAIIKDREEMDNDTSEDEDDADVGLRGDLDKTNELFTNEIPRSRVEATTYAVDLKDEVEFVPVRNYQL